MGGKKKTKWRKLPLGELTQGTARGSTGSGSLREQIEDGLPESTFSSRRHYDTKSDEYQWEDARHAGYYAQGPPHLYSSNTALREQDDVNQEETAGSDEKTDTFYNGFWIPDSDLDQFNAINNAFEPFFRQVPVFFCPPIMPYCSAPYPHFRSAYSSEAPLFTNFCIPSDSHYYYYFNRARTTSAEEDYPSESKVESTSPPVSDSDTGDTQQAPQQQQLESNFENGENQQTPLHPEMTTDTALTYPYPGYSFGEPVYSVPVYPLLPPVPRSYPRLPWSATQTQRKRRRKRKEYNADYAVIPATKNSSQGNTGTTDSKSDLGITRDNRTGNNECCNQQKGNGTHSVSVTGSSPSTKEANQNDCVLNNQKNDDAESAYLSQKEITAQDAANLVESTTGHEEFLKKGHCDIIEEGAIVAEILSELIQEVVNASPQVLEKCKSSKSESNYQSTQNETGNTNHAIESCGNSDVSSAHFEMENVLLRNQNANLPEVHKKFQSDLGGIENSGSDTSYCNNETSGDSFVQNENRKNLSRGKPVKLCINEENNFFDISLVHEEGDAATEEGLFTEIGSNVEREDKVTENKQPKVQDDDLRDLEQSDLHNHNLTTEEQSYFLVEKHKVRSQNQQDLDNASEYLDFRTDTTEVRNPCSDDEAKNCEDSLDSLTSNESCRDKQLSDSHRSSPHSFLSYVANSEALIRETELELSKIQHLTSRPPLQANQSIYKFAFDENLSDQSDTEDKMTPIPSSPFPELSDDYRKNADAEDAAVSAEMRQDVQRSEIVVHEGDSASEAGSEDVELLPHRYESQCGDKHLYVNKLSLAVELLRTHEKLPYDDEFKRVVDEEGENGQLGKGDVASAKSRSNKAANVSSGTVNPAFVDDPSPKFLVPVEISPPLNDVNARPGFQKSPAPVRSLQDIKLHRHSRISTADSGVQSEDSGDEMCEEAKEVYGRLGFTESEEQELWNPASDATMAYRRFGAQAPQRFNIFTPRAGGLNPCFCCIIM